MKRDRILVVGLGNPILGDDGVGWLVVERLREQLEAGVADVECLSVGGLRLMEFMIGYTHTIIVDAITTRQNPPGSVTCFPLAAMPDLTAGHTTAVHDVSLQSALEVGRKMNLPLPSEVMVVGIEAHNVFDFSENLSDPVRAAVPIAIARVMQLIDDYRRNPRDDFP